MLVVQRQERRHAKVAGRCVIAYRKFQPLCILGELDYFVDFQKKNRKDLQVMVSPWNGSMRTKKGCLVIVIVMVGWLFRWSLTESWLVVVR